MLIQHYHMVKHTLQKLEKRLSGFKHPYSSFTQASPVRTAYDFMAIVVILVSDVVEIDLNKFAAMDVTITDTGR